MNIILSSQSIILLYTRQLSNIFQTQFNSFIWNPEDFEISCECRYKEQERYKFFGTRTT